MSAFPPAEEEESSANCLLKDSFINVSMSLPECVVHTCRVLSAGRWQEVLELKLQQTSNKELHGKRCEDKGGAGVLQACVGLFGITVNPILISQPKTCPAKELGKKPLTAGTAQTRARGRAEVGLEESTPVPWAEGG